MSASFAFDMMLPFGTKLTWAIHWSMSAFEGRSDVPRLALLTEPNPQNRPSGLFMSHVLVSKVEHLRSFKKKSVCS
jgi:hypothetical protein